MGKADIEQSSVERFAALFAGDTEAHGVYDGATKQREDGKLIGSVVKTVREKVTTEHYAKHLNGISSLGIIPIMRNGDCAFGCADIDCYDGLDLKGLASRIERLALPLTVCRSKSGGAHILVFLAQP